MFLGHGQEKEENLKTLTGTYSTFCFLLKVIAGAGGCVTPVVPNTSPAVKLHLPSWLKMG